MIQKSDMDHYLLHIEQMRDIVLIQDVIQSLREELLRQDQLIRQLRSRVNVLERITDHGTPTHAVEVVYTDEVGSPQDGMGPRRGVQSGGCA